MRKLIIYKTLFKNGLLVRFADNITRLNCYMTKYCFSFLAALSLIICAQGIVYAAENYTVTIENHLFTPTELKVPVGQKIRLIVKNEDATPEEFESKALKREKVVAGKSHIVLSIGPLEAGVYDFVGEFHESTAKGRIVAE